MEFVRIIFLNHSLCPFPCLYRKLFLFEHQTENFLILLFRHLQQTLAQMDSANKHLLFEHLDFLPCYFSYLISVRLKHQISIVFSTCLPKAQAKPKKGQNFQWFLNWEQLTFLILKELILRNYGQSIYFQARCRQNTSPNK